MSEASRPISLTSVLGEKRKVPVVESMTQQEQKTITMKEWIDYFNTPAGDRTAIVPFFPLFDPLLPLFSSIALFVIFFHRLSLFFFIFRSSMSFFSYFFHS
jgi:hypothetical protein